MLLFIFHYFWFKYQILIVLSYGSFGHCPKLIYFLHFYVYCHKVIFITCRRRKQEKNAYISSNDRNYSNDVTRFVIEDATSTTSPDCFLFNNIKLSFSFIFICLNNYQNSINSLHPYDCLIHNQFFWIKSLYGSIKRIWGEKRQKKME